MQHFLYAMGETNYSGVIKINITKRKDFLKEFQKSYPLELHVYALKSVGKKINAERAINLFYFENIKKIVKNDWYALSLGEIKNIFGELLTKPSILYPIKPAPLEQVKNIVRRLNSENYHTVKKGEYKEQKGKNKLYVTAIGATNYNGFIKIGYSTDVTATLQRISDDNPTDCSLYGKIRYQNEQITKKVSNIMHFELLNFKAKSFWYALGLTELRVLFPKQPKQPKIKHHAYIAPQQEDLSLQKTEKQKEHEKKILKELEKRLLTNADTLR